jgi:hypothetical protein
MGITASLLLTAAGAVLTWGVNASSSGFNINTIGIILMVVGIVGFITSLIFWSSWGGGAGDRASGRVAARRDGKPGPLLKG